MDPEQKINIKSDPTLKIGSTKISLLKENLYTIESTSLLLDSINENIVHHSEHQIHSKQINMTPVSDETGKGKGAKETKNKT